jgi:hypothetical protein
MRFPNVQTPWLATLAILTAIAMPSYAVDGIVLINQNAALAGNVTPGDAPGFPVTITVSGSYKLSSNLTVPDADTTAIQINADDVTVDLNGFSISGKTICVGFPVTSCNPTGPGLGITSQNTNVTVLNGTVRGMGGVGISLLGGHSRIERVQAIGNGSSGLVANPLFPTFTGDSIITSCIATQNGSLGIGVGGLGANNVSNGNLEGMELIRSGVAINNTTNNNIRDGISGVGAFIGNSAFDNVGPGLSVGCPSTVVSNAAARNGAGGDIVLAGTASTCTRANNTPAP